MNIAVERSRIIFTDYTETERTALQELVAAEDHIFIYEDVDNGMICLPPGMLISVRNKFPTVSITDNSDSYSKYELIDPVQHQAEPRNEMQVNFIKYLLGHAESGNKVGGVLPPGAGKTFMACYCAIKVGLRTLIITPTSSVREQWADTLTGMFGIDSNKVKVVKGSADFINIKSDFTIVTQASLASLNKNHDLPKIMKDNKFGIKIIDEAHMFFQNTIRVDSSSNIFHNWYLTGTFGRSAEEENRIYKEMFGDIHIFRVSNLKPTFDNRVPGDEYGQKPHMNTKMIWTSSNISPEDKEKVSGSMRYSERQKKWVRYGISIPAYTSIIIPEDGSETKMLKTIFRIIKMANKDCPYGKMLVLTPTISSVQILETHLIRMFPDKSVGGIHSLNSKIKNDTIKANCDILISTVKSAGTGFDVKGLSKLVVIEQFASWILADQVSGRLRRRDDGKDTYMYDIVDSDIDQLRAWGNSRMKVLKGKSKSFKVVRM